MLNLKIFDSEPSHQGTSSKKRGNRSVFGLIERKEKWTLSGRGKIGVLLATIVLISLFVLNIHPFLAVTHREDSQYLVVEGWLPNYALEESIREFKTKNYRMMFTVGADSLMDADLAEEEGVAIEGFRELKRLGMSPETIQAVPAHVKYRDRTFQSALALKKWLKDNHIVTKSINVVTLGPHARRSRLLFRKAFGDEVRVGVISLEDREYDPKEWWEYSAGVKAVMGEGIGYVYALCLFHPASVNLP